MQHEGHHSLTKTSSWLSSWSSWSWPPPSSSPSWSAARHHDHLLEDSWESRLVLSFEACIGIIDMMMVMTMMTMTMMTTTMMMTTTTIIIIIVIIKHHQHQHHHLQYIIVVGIGITLACQIWQARLFSSHGYSNPWYSNARYRNIGLWEASFAVQVGLHYGHRVCPLPEVMCPHLV